MLLILCSSYCTTSSGGEPNILIIGWNRRVSFSDKRSKMEVSKLVREGVLFVLTAEVTLGLGGGCFCFGRRLTFFVQIQTWLWGIQISFPYAIFYLRIWHIWYLAFLHPKCREYSFFSHVHHTYSRIDNFFHRQ